MLIIQCSLKKTESDAAVFPLSFSCVWRLQRQPGNICNFYTLKGIKQQHKVFKSDVCLGVSQGRVWLIDVNPFGEVTDSLLFSWEELTSGGEIAQQQVGDLICLVCTTMIQFFLKNINRLLSVSRSAPRSAAPPARWRCSPVPVWATESHGTLWTSPREKTLTNSSTSSNW